MADLVEKARAEAFVPKTYPEDDAGPWLDWATVQRKNIHALADEVERLRGALRVIERDLMVISGGLQGLGDQQRAVSGSVATAQERAGLLTSNVRQVLNPQEEKARG